MGAGEGLRSGDAALFLLGAALERGAFFSVVVVVDFGAALEAGFDEAALEGRVAGICEGEEQNNNRPSSLKSMKREQGGGSGQDDTTVNDRT